MNLNLNFDISTDTQWNNKSYRNDEHFEFIEKFSKFVIKCRSNEVMNELFSENIPLLKYNYILECLKGKFFKNLPRNLIFLFFFFLHL